MQLISKDIGLCIPFLCIFLKDRCSCKTKENRTRKCLLDHCQHLTKRGSVRLIDDKDNSLPTDDLHIVSIPSAFFIADIAHFLDGSDDQGIFYLVAL